MVIFASTELEELVELGDVIVTSGGVSVGCGFSQSFAIGANSCFAIANVVGYGGTALHPALLARDLGEDPAFGTEPRRSIPPTCAIASMISTPGITGYPGKWPWKNPSLIETFLIALIRWPLSHSSTRSTSRNGYRCGNNF